MQWIRDHASYQGDDCIKWPFEVSHYGYGSVRHIGKKRVASRVMCEIAHGLPSDDGLEAAHSCGNGHLACMNPNHIRWATREENVADSIAHGTWALGRLKAARLKESEVREIKDLLGRETNKSIAAKFGIDSSQVSRIRNGKAWHWVDEL